MTQDEIIRMARESGLPTSIDGITLIPLIERFAALVAAHEREACAKMCEKLEQFYEHTVAPQQCAYNIRARSN